MTKDNPFGDDAGTRVGRPDTPQRDNLGTKARGDLEGGGDGGDLGAGKESTGGIPEHGNPAGGQRPQAEPPRRKEDKGSGYGGDRGDPKTSSDQK